MSGKRIVCVGRWSRVYVGTPFVPFVRPQTILQTKTFMLNHGDCQSRNLFEKKVHKNPRSMEYDDRLRIPAFKRESWSRQKSSGGLMELLSDSTEIYRFLHFQTYPPLAFILGISKRLVMGSSGLSIANSLISRIRFVSPLTNS